MAEKNLDCDHKNSLVPVGQNLVVVGEEVLVIVSTLCPKCNQVLTNTTKIKLNIGKGSLPVFTPQIKK